MGCMKILDELMAFHDLPNWLHCRFALVEKEINNKNYEFYIQNLQTSEHEFKGNNGSAYFLTNDELIRVDFSIDSIRLNKNKLVNVLEINKIIETPTKDNFYGEGVQYKSVTIKFDKDKSIVLIPPTINDEINYSKYINLVSKL